ncbi:MAG TPA: enolase C-terminal domain-like protein, partial [Thermoanaerobaculia bacterium]|nr:enolase C-terminal domain-like protein [Thermoanaerobaculia bacterium]
MDLYYWRYTLVPKRPLNTLSMGQPRQGALIRRGDGVADVHPWVELDDLPLDEQLSRLARGELTALTRASLRHAEADGSARARGVSLFEGQEIPRSHWPLSAGSIPDGFEYVKVKAGPTSDPGELKGLTGHRIRVDFNGTLTEEQFLRWAGALTSAVREAIDFVEDPCPYDDADAWRALRKATGL